MKKLRLQLDDLRVDSFDTAAPDAAQGTVEGYATLRCTGDYATCRYAGETCGEADTCNANCPGLTWIDSCPCDPGDSYNCNTDGASCNAASCIYTCTWCNSFGCGSC